MVREPAEPGFFNIEILDDCENSGATVEKLMDALVGGYEHSFMVVADGVSISQPDHPLLVVDLVVDRGRQFRAAAAHVAEIDNNLSIANMGFEEFAGLLDASGIYRGLPEM